MVLLGYQWSRWQIIGWSLAVILTSTSILIFNVRYRSQQAYLSGEKAFSTGTYTRAIQHYERAIKWYVPFSETVQQSVRRLWQIARAAEGRSDTFLALRAYRALRASLYATQSIYQPYRSWIPKCEARIAALMADSKVSTSSHDLSHQAHRDRFAQMFKRQSGPHFGATFLVELGFLAWMGATIGLIWHVEVGAKRWTWRYGKWWGSGIVLGFAAWIYGMLYA